MFTWNTTGLSYGNYTLSARTLPFPVTTSNNCVILVTIPGDLTGPNGIPNGKVDMRDVAYVARRFGTTPSSALWDPNADIDDDGKIDMKDIAIVAGNFGQYY